MGNRQKNKNKNKQTGGLQPKGGAYANKDAILAAEGSAAVDPVVANAALKEKAKAEKAKSKEKAKKEKQEKKKEKKGLIKSLRDTGGELKKVRWPSFSNTLKQTGVVLGVVVLFGIVVFGLDRGLSALYDLLTKGF